MKTALISDIHGNYAGLMATLNDIEKCDCDRIICLGDVVEGGEKNRECFVELQQRNIPIVRGNHDEINDLSDFKLKSQLQKLPEYLVEKDILYTHISPRKKQYSLNNNTEAWNVFDETTYKLIFVGHLHVSLIFGENSDTPFCAKRHTFVFNRPYPLERTNRYIICVGAIGYSRSALQKISYAIYDDTEYTIEMKAIEGPLLEL
ncbi:metallophosphoesterase family protein [Candidatus Uabimicrobium amorphum]|nr:metallophosphoesterase family protein [Candidatus Uabimicrobium amorphum]